MGTVVNFSRLAHLREKTNRDLVRILEAEIERGLALGNVAASRRSTFYSEAEAVYAANTALLGRITGLDSAQAAKLERKLKELRMALDLVPGAMRMEEQPVSSQAVEA